jgi:hypothetical protein
MNYEKTKQDAISRKQELTERQKQLAAEKATLDKESEQIQRELIGLDELLETIEFMTNEAIAPDLEPVGFTEQIRVIFQETTSPLTAVQIRDILLEKGVTGSSPKNLLISVHTIIAREKENLETVNMDGKNAYLWKGIRRFPRMRTARMRAFIGQGTSSDDKHGSVVNIGKNYTTRIRGLSNKKE